MSHLMIYSDHQRDKVPSQKSQAALINSFSQLSSIHKYPQVAVTPKNLLTHEKALQPDISHMIELNSCETLCIEFCLQNEYINGITVPVICKHFKNNIQYTFALIWRNSTDWGKTLLTLCYLNYWNLEVVMSSAYPLWGNLIIVTTSYVSYTCKICTPGPLLLTSITWNPSIAY